MNNCDAEGGFQRGLSLGWSDLEGRHTYMESVTGRCMPLERTGAVVTFKGGVSCLLPGKQLCIHAAVVGVGGLQDPTQFGIEFQRSGCAFF